MTERAITALFDDLVQRAVAELTRPGLPVDRDLAALGEEIDEAIRRPVEGERLIAEEEALLLQALLLLNQARRDHDKERERTWQLIVCVMTGVVRERWWRAVAATKRGTVATTDQDYANRKR